MIFFFKVILEKISFGLRILLAIFIPSTILMLLAPYLMDNYSPLLSENMAKNLLVFRETLFYFFVSVAVMMMGVVGYLFWWLKKYRTHIEKVFTHVESMGRDEIRGEFYQEELDKILKSYSLDFQKIQQKERLRQNFLLERLESLDSIRRNLYLQLKEVEKTIKSSSKFFDHLEQKVQAVSQENLLYLTGNKFNQLNENIFKIQLHVFNISVETFKDFAATDENIPPLTKEVETLISQSGEIIEELYRSLEENEENKVRGKKELIEALMETGRHLTQISFSFGKFISGLEKLEKALLEFKKDLSDRGETDATQLREKENKNLKEIIQNIVEKSNGVLGHMNQLLYPEVDFFKKQHSSNVKEEINNQDKVKNEVEEVAPDERVLSEIKSAPVDQNELVTPSTPLVPLAALASLDPLSAVRVEEKVSPEIEDQVEENLKFESEIQADIQQEEEQEQEEEVEIIEDEIQDEAIESEEEIRAEEASDNLTKEEIAEETDEEIEEEVEEEVEDFDHGMIEVIDDNPDQRASIPVELLEKIREENRRSLEGLSPAEILKQI